MPVFNLIGGHGHLFVGDGVLKYKNSEGAVRVIDGDPGAAKLSAAEPKPQVELPRRSAWKRLIDEDTE
jgi:hypothetical protein